MELRAERFRDACWFSWLEQTRSLRRLLDYRFEWVFAGHGGSQHLPPDEMHGCLQRFSTVWPKPGEAVGSAAARQSR
jgi:hypothetical protein